MFDNQVTCFSKVLSQKVCIMWTLYLLELRWPLLARACEVHKRVPFIILWFWKMLMCTGYLPFARFTLIVTLHNILFPKCGLECEYLGRIWSGHGTVCNIKWQSIFYLSYEMSVTLTFQCKFGPIYSVWLYFKANSCVLFAVIMKSLCIHLDVEFTFACLSIYPRSVMAWAAIDQSC